MTKALLMVALLAGVAHADGSGSATGNSGSAADPGGGSAVGPGPGSAAGSGVGSAAGSGSGIGSAAGSGSGSAHKKVIIDIPADVVPPEVTASASPTVARLGKSITLFITAKRLAGTEVNLAEPVELGGAFEVRRKLSVEDKTLPDGTLLREWQLEITPWELGELQIPEIGVTFVQRGKAGQVATNAVPVRVVGLLGDVDDPKLMRGLEPPKALQSQDWKLLYIAAAVAAGLAIALAFWRFRRRRRVHEEELTAGSGIVPRRMDMTSERALEQLLAIEKRGDLDRPDDRRQGYVAMFEVIREYLGARYRVASLDLTTSELVRRLEQVASVGELAVIESWLERCDLVRYGGLRPTHAEARTSLGDARSLVLTTTTQEKAAA